MALADAELLQKEHLAGMQYLWEGKQGLSIIGVNRVQNEDGLLTYKNGSRCLF